MLLLVLVVIGIILGLLLAAWTLWIQGYFYTEPTQGILWQAPVASGAIVLFLGFWCLINYNSPGLYREFQAFNPQETKTYPEMKVTTRQGEKLVTLRLNARGIPEYRIPHSQEKPRLTRPEKIVVAERDGQPARFTSSADQPPPDTYTFVPRRKAEGKFQPDSDGKLRYRDERGQVMVEGYLGQVTIFYTGRFIVGMFLNLVHLGLWFVVLWLLLRFHWGHALVQALVLWTITSFFLLPMLLERADNAGVADQTSRERQR